MDALKDRRHSVQKAHPASEARRPFEHTSEMPNADQQMGVRHSHQVNISGTSGGLILFSYLTKTSIGSPVCTLQTIKLRPRRVAHSDEKTFFTDRKLCR